MRIPGYEDGMTNIIDNACPDVGISFSPLVYLLTLGCDKNRVDGEVMLGRLIEAGFAPVIDAGEADVIIVNTCGFIREATQESIDAVLEMAAYKADPDAPCRALIIVGCMSERYREETKESIPEADAVLGVKDSDGIVLVVSEILGISGGSQSSFDLIDGVLPQGAHRGRMAARGFVQAPHIAYVKISDGCDNACTYCTIPSIRGAYTSRSIEDIVEECSALISSGVRELVLVAQDTALYGVDLYGSSQLAKLLREIAALSGCIWIRIMYAYPEHITEELIQAMADLPNVCKYIDMPIQHSETGVLRRMGRSSSREGLLELIGNMRAKIPGIALRTTLMVGFPGETVEDFKGLYDFVREVKFDRLGVFPYSREEGTPAAMMPRQVKDEVKHTRRDRLMRLQQKIHQEKQQAKIGKTIDVIIDEHLEDGRYVGRTQHDAYEVDAVVFFDKGRKVTPVSIGDIVKATISAADEYDLKSLYVNC